MKHALARRLALLAAAVLLPLAAVAVPGRIAHADDAVASFAKVSDWGSGWEGKYTISNGGQSTITNWRVEFGLPAGSEIGSHWDALRESDGDHHSFSNREYNGTIAPGASVTFGFLGSGTGSPVGCRFNGESCSGGGDPGTPGAPSAPQSPKVTGTTSSTIAISWSAPAGSVTGYRVYEGDTLHTTVTGTSATVSGLEACSTHTFSVAAYNDAGQSPRSASVTASTPGCQQDSLPRHFLTGYWHNFVNPAVELRLRDVPAEYDLVAAAFAEATGTPGAVTFAVDPGLSTALGGYTDADFQADVRTLKARGTKVILSVGGEAGRVSVGDSASAENFARSVHAIMREFGFDGVDIDLENGLNPIYMAQALRSLRSMAGSGLIITMAPQTIDMQSPGASYFRLALDIKDILTVVHTQFYNSGSMLGCDQSQAYGQGTVNFLTALTCLQLENGLRPDQVALGLPAGPGAAGGGVVAPSVVTDALDCFAKGTRCGSFQPPRTYPDIRGAMTWSINWDVSNGNDFARTVGPHLDTLP
ncbi:cellulose binding domain-containing protein [Amycolatopsis palatopharyngis]|uniref:cellulose binding domain-containing protein n=1 Tax=Amycolatopsis palatopharyngis TaxID=187982 RepID=UPI000E27AC4D|nr:cellulose binding domain-containing protein [Amycolatopsis palatopharyngis]